MFQWMKLKEFRIFHILFCITFLVKGLVINLTQVILYLLLPRRLFHKLNYYTVNGIYGTLLCLADWWGGSSITLCCSDSLYEKIKNRNFEKRQLIVVNHHTELDWLLCWQLADRIEVLGGCRALAKKSLKWVPIIGWSSCMSGDIFLSRSWEKDQLNVKEKVHALEDQPHPTWLFVFPEGTRFNETKHKASVEFAESRGLPRLNHHLIPRTKGFALTSEHMKGGLIDVTIVQGPKSPPTLTSLMMGKDVDTRMYVREFDLSAVPKGEKEAGEWLMQLFREKDEIKGAFLTEDWDKLSVAFGDFKSRPLPRRSWSLYWTIFTNVIVLTPLFILVLQGGPITWISTVLVLALAWLALNMLVSVSKIKKEA